MTDKLNPWGRPITEATPGTGSMPNAWTARRKAITESAPTPASESMPNAWTSRRRGETPAPGAESSSNPWTARHRGVPFKPDTPTTTTTARFGTETTPVTGSAPNAWMARRGATATPAVESTGNPWTDRRLGIPFKPKTTPVTETKPAPKLAPIPIPKATKAKQEAKPAGGGRVTIITDNPERVRAQIRQMREVLARLK